MKKRNIKYRGQYVHHLHTENASFVLWRLFTKLLITPRKSLLVWNYELYFEHKSFIVCTWYKKKVEEKMNNNYMLGTCIFIFECQIQCITFMCCSCIYVLQTYIPMQACNIQVSKPPDIWLCPAVWRYLKNPDSSDPH